MTGNVSANAPSNTAAMAVGFVGPPIDDNSAPTIATPPSSAASTIRSSRSGPPCATSYPQSPRSGEVGRC